MSVRSLYQEVICASLVVPFNNLPVCINQNQSNFNFENSLTNKHLILLIDQCVYMSYCTLTYPIIKVTNFLSCTLVLVIIFSCENVYSIANVIQYNIITKSFVYYMPLKFIQVLQNDIQEFIWQSLYYKFFTMIEQGVTDMGFPREIDQDNAPHEFLCPISKEIMKDPVITVDGYSFQRQVIQKWFTTKDKSPITGLKIDKKIVQNRALKQAIRYHNQRDAKANLNAQKLLQHSNKYIIDTLPQLVNDIHLVDVDKLVSISIQNLQLRKTLTKIRKQLKDLEIRNAGIAKLCQGCFRIKDCHHTITNLIKGAQNILESQPIIKQLNIQAKQFQYLPISCSDLKKIDFQYIRKNQFQKKIFKSYGIQKSPLEDLLKRIRVVNKIPDTNFTQIWRVSMPIDKFYDYIKKQLLNQSCTYVKKVKSLGTRIMNLKIKLDELKLGSNQYLIIQTGKDEQYVFRGQSNKCRYCYNYRPQKFQCCCERVSYCSLPCAEKDIEFHVKQCPDHKIIPIEQRKEF